MGRFDVWPGWYHRQRCDGEPVALARDDPAASTAHYLAGRCAKCSTLVMRDAEPMGENHDPRERLEHAAGVGA